MGYVNRYILGYISITISITEASLKHWDPVPANNNVATWKAEKVKDNQNPPGDARTGCSNPKRARRGVMSAGALRRHLNLASSSDSIILVS